MTMKALTLDDLSVDWLSVLSTQTKTDATHRMLYTVLKELNRIKGVTWEFDEYGNLYATKGKADTYPAYVCHLDTVHMFRETFTVQNFEGYLYALSTDNGELTQVGVGGDDKCGIINCLEILHRLKTVKCAFFLDEESGCKGSSEGRLEFFDDCRFAIQIDRKNGGDIITNGNGTELCSTEFKNVISEIGKAYGYKPTTGASTDVVTLKKRGLGISAVNLSAGYYNPHGKQEFIIAAELLNCLQLCLAMARIKTVFNHKTPVYTTPARTAGYTTPGRTLFRSGKPFRPADRACSECKGTLNAQESDQRIHDKCLAELYVKFESQIKTLHLSDDGESVLEIEQTTRPVDSDLEVLLPANMWGALPTGSCLICKAKMIHMPEKARGYCGACAYCSCGEKLMSSSELVHAECEKCVVTNINANEKSLDMCASSGCTNRLEDDIEKMEQMCGECRAEIMLA